MPYLRKRGYMWVLKIVTDGQIDSLTNLIKCVVVCHSYSSTSWSMSLWDPNIHPSLYHCMGKKKQQNCRDSRNWENSGKIK